MAGGSKKKSDKAKAETKRREQPELEKETAPDIPEEKEQEKVPALEQDDAVTDGSAPVESESEEMDEVPEAEELANGESEAERDQATSNNFLRQMMEVNFIEYASYVIKERAIPDVDDGLKPVQRRILWSLHRMDDGKFHKVANVIGHTMQYHPHGDASIGSALVVLANKEYYIDRQGNFGNILTGDEASAARYIECRLTPLAREVLFNNDITEFTDSYDGRNKEPIRLPCKVPSLLMLGADGIAVGMATHILPHNFKELLEAQIAILKNEEYEIYPDFLQGGRMDVSNYEDGNGKITLRAKIEREGRKLIIREIPASTTVDSLIASIEKAAERNKIKIASINDYTTENVEIEITPMRGYDPEKALKALFAYTDCSVSINVNLMVICDNRPVQMTVPEIIERNTEKLLQYLKMELEIELGKLNDKFHSKTLEQIFIENRIYKRIEDCESFEKVRSEVRTGVEKFRKMLKRDISEDDIDMLLAIPIRRISLFDINKNKKDIDEILAAIEEVEKNLRNLKRYAIKYIQALIDKYGEQFPRRTEIETLKKIDRKAVALNNIRVGWDRKNCYIGTSVRSEDQVVCNEFDHLLLVERKGKYKVVNIPDKVFCGRLFEFRKYDKETEFGVIYRDKKTNKCYAKRCVIDKFITDREYMLCPKNCVLEVLTPRADSIYECTVDTRVKEKRKLEYNLMEAPERSPRARGLLIDSKKITKIKHLRYLEPEEIEPEEEVSAKAEAEEVEEVRETSEGQEKPQKQEPKEEKAVKPKKSKKDDDDNDNEPPEKPEKAGKPEKDVEKVEGPKEAQKKSKSAKPEPAKEKKSEPEKKSAPPAKPEKKSEPAPKQENKEEEKKPDAKKKSAKPEKTKKSKGESLEMPGAEEIDEDSAAKKRKSSPAAKSEKNNSPEDDFGITQPEFGF